MPEADSHNGRIAVPAFIQRRIDSYPILAGENREDLKSIFFTFAHGVGESAETAIDHALVFRLAVVHFELPRYENMRVKFIDHCRRASVLELLSHAHLPEAERGSLADMERKLMARGYHTSESNKAAITKLLADAGYAADAIEVESFRQALPDLIILDRQIADLQRQMTALFRELDRRYARRAKHIQNLSETILSRRRLRKQPEPS